MNDKDLRLLSTSLREHAIPYCSMIIPKGWLIHLAHMHEHIQTIFPEYTITSIASTSGKLHFNIAPVPLHKTEVMGEIYQVIRHYEYLSQYICMNCGADGFINLSFGRALCTTCTEMYRLYYMDRNDHFKRGGTFDELDPEIKKFFDSISGINTLMAPEPTA